MEQPLTPCHSPSLRLQPSHHGTVCAKHCRTYQFASTSTLGVLPEHLLYRAQGHPCLKACFSFSCSSMMLAMQRAQGLPQLVPTSSLALLPVYPLCKEPWHPLDWTHFSFSYFARVLCVKNPRTIPGHEYFSSSQDPQPSASRSFSWLGHQAHIVYTGNNHT